MNSLWIGNLIIFVVALVPTRSDDQIKIRVFYALRSRPWLNLVKLDKNL